MAQDQLKQAFALIKQGNKAEASTLIKSVLREDRNNPNAWWLMAMVVEDDDKRIRAAKKVLELKPDHIGATKLLTRLAPQELPNNDADDFFAVDADGAKSLPDIDVPAKPKRKAKREDSGTKIAMYAIFAFGGFAVIAILVGIIMTIADGGNGNGSGSERTWTLDVERDGTSSIDYQYTGYLSITAEGLDGADAVLEVLDSSGNLLVRNDDHEGYPGLDFLDAAVPFTRSNGEVTVRVSTFAGNPGEIRITITEIDLETFVNATLNVGESAEIDITDNDGIGVVEIRGSGTVTVTAEATGSSDVDPVLELVDRNGTFIVRNDDHNTELNLGTFDAAVERISISGRTYAVITDFFGNARDGEVTVRVRGN
ncbi:MAG: hypothetical protein AAFV98_08455 [Chloroflexota bacterium]